LQSYTVTLTSGVKDLAGNRLTSENWSFTTEAQPTSGGGDNTGSGSNNTGFENLGDSLGLTLPNANLDAAAAQSTPANSNNSSDFGVINKDVITLPKGQAYIQLLNDVELVDRILPLIVDKIDVNTLIAKADGQQLLKRVLPYLDVKVTATEGIGEVKEYHLGSTLAGASQSAYQTAHCEPDEQIVERGIGADGKNVVDAIKGFHRVEGSPLWSFYLHLGSDGKVTVYAQCLKTEVGLKQIPSRISNK
jgi:Big-like domain-containing protein